MSSTRIAMVLACALALVTGCVANNGLPAASPTQTAEAQVIPSGSSVPLSTPSVSVPTPPTFTPTVFTPASTQTESRVAPTQLTTVSTRQGLVQKCASTSILGSPSLIRAGSLVITDLHGIATISAKSPKPNILANAEQVFAVAVVSQETGTVAWLTDREIVIRTADGKESRIARSTDMAYIRQWLDGGRLLIGKTVSPNRDTSQLIPAVDSFYVVSPDSSQTVSVTAVLGGWLAANVHWFSRPPYDSTFTYAIYAWQSHDFADTGFELWDLASGKSVWMEGGWDGLIDYSGMDWESNGSRLVLVGPASGQQPPYQPELLSVEPSGNVQQRTRLNEVYSGSSGGYTLWSPKWSPDGCYIAFVYDETPRTLVDLGWLYVLDTSTGTVTDYCIDQVSKNNMLYWSPNGDQLALVRGDQRNIFVLDLQSDNLQQATNTKAFLNGWVSWISP